MKTIFGAIAILLLLVFVPLSFAQNCGPMPSSYGTTLSALESWCASKNGQIVNLGGGSLGCRCPEASASASTATAYPAGYVPFVSEILALFNMAATDSAEAARRRTALKAQLEYERQAAIERKQAEEVARLDNILLRLRSTLKGLGPGNDLQLKLSPTGPIRFGEYMSTPATQTTKAELRLKTGDEATQSLKPTGNASSAGVINPNQPPAWNADNMSTEQREIADILSKLTPEQQQRLLASIKNSDTAVATTGTQTQQTAGGPPTSPPEETKKSETLTLKLSTDQKTADDLKAAANSGALPEQLQKQSADQFKQLQQTTLTSTQTTTTAGGSPPAGGQPPNSTGACAATSNSDPNTVDLRCVGDSKPTKLADPSSGAAAMQPGKDPSVVAPTNDDLKLLFADQLERARPRSTAEERGKVDDVFLQLLGPAPWPGPTNPDAPLKNPLREKENEELKAQLKFLYAMNLLDVKDTAPPLKSEDFDTLVKFFSPVVATRYASDKVFKQSIDYMIDANVRLAQNDRAERLVAASDAIVTKLKNVKERYGAAFDIGDPDAFNKDPRLKAEAERIMNEYRRDAKDATNGSQTSLFITLQQQFEGFEKLLSNPKPR